MQLHEWFWCGLAVLMVARLIWCRGWSVFAAVQLIELLEIPLVVIWPGWNPWHELTKINVVLDIIGLYFLGTRMPWATTAIITYDLLKVFREMPFDCDYQLTVVPMSWVACWINRLSILILLAYTLDIPRLRSKGESCQAIPIPTQ